MGNQFLNFLIQKMTDKFQIDHRKTTPYYPQTNGKTKQVNDILVNIVRKTILDSKTDWDVKLPATLWAYRTTYKVITQATFFSLVCGLEAILPIGYEVESLRVAIGSHLTKSQSLRIGWLTWKSSMREEGWRFKTLRHPTSAFDIFDKQHKKRAVAALASSPYLTWSFFRLSKGYEC